MASLNFFASGSYQRRVGMDAFSCIAQSTMSNIIREMCRLIERNMFHRFVRFPETEQRLNLLKDR